MLVWLRSLCFVVCLGVFAAAPSSAFAENLLTEAPKQSAQDFINQGSAEETETVKEIRVEGNQRIEPSAVETYLGISKGQKVGHYDLDLGLKKLYDTGFFADVGLDFDHGVLTARVQENPSINEVIFEGNDQIDKEDLSKEVTLKPRSIYTRTKVANDLKRLLDVYRHHGRYSAQITPQIIKLPDNRVNLVYSITEGPKAFIEKITFIGNETYGSSDLEPIITSARNHWYNFLSDNDKYDPDRLNYDQELLRRFYFSNGYADFKVKSAIAELNPQKDAFYLTFTVEEGPQYKFGTIDVDSKLPKGKLPDFNKAILTKSDSTYNATEVEDSIDKMVDILGDHGFAFVDIEPVTKRRPGPEKIIDLTYEIKEGPRVYVERINIFGNQRTLDSVVRREFRLAEGDAYSTSKIKRTEQRLNNLNFFNKVSIENKPGSSPDKTDINVAVEEKSTGEISLGAGYSTTDGPLVDAGITEHNFLGHGQELRLRTMLAGRRQEYDVGFTEPYFLDRELEAGFDLYKTQEDLSDTSSFSREAIGGVMRLTYALSEHLKHQMRYTYEDSRIGNIQPGASIFILQQQGQDVTSMIGHSLIYDERDSKQNPTSGYYWRVNQDLAGLGGDDRFIRHELQGEYYYPIAKKWTFFTAGSAGNILGIGKDIRINQRFFIGSQQIRGFAPSGIGARDQGTGDPLGGENYYAGSVELRFPLGLADDLGVTGAIFTDIGSEWGIHPTGTGIDDAAAMRASVGFGIAWASPFGPIRIDLADALLKQSYDHNQLIRFSFGTRF